MKFKNRNQNTFPHTLDALHTRYSFRAVRKIFENAILMYYKLQFRAGCL